MEPGYYAPDRPVGRSGRRLPGIGHYVNRKFGYEKLEYAEQISTKPHGMASTSPGTTTAQWQGPYFVREVASRRKWAMRRLARLFVAAMCIALVPLAASAQTSTIAGTVRDASGAVLPGVTVEVASPALIEKVRTATTDGSGQYQIVQLRPGTYSVTFTLPGFTVVKRENVELTSDFTATINADLKVGAVEETITVSAESPVVDVQNITTRTVMTRDVLDAIPTGRNIQAIGIMIPGTNIAQ